MTEDVNLREVAIRELAGTVRHLAGTGAAIGGHFTFERHIAEGVEALAQVAAGEEQRAMLASRRLAEEATSLRGRIAKVEQDRDAALRDAKHAQAEVELLRKALAPFADGKTRAAKRAKQALDRTAPVPF